jgi:opacity protein-like surface antigen
MKKLLLAIFLFISPLAKGQILISLVFGKHLNTGKIEFGLDGGLNLSNLPGTEGDNKYTREFNLGFYFDIKLKNPSWMFRTGVIVKSTMGASELDVYPTGDTNLDSLMIGGSLDRQINYFNVPIQLKYVTPVRVYFEGGVMTGLRYKARDEFSNTVAGEDLTYEKDIKDQIQPLDFGAMAGIGYRLTKGHGMNLAFRYYHGFVDITKDDNASVYNQSYYFTVGIPIGVGKSKENQETAP